MRPLVSVLLIAAATSAAAAPKPSWRALADCAGAYVANSRVADPDRPATMVGQMDEVAQDYAKAARAAYRGDANAGRRAVRARIDATAARLAKAPREAAEKLIDACPQVGG